MSLKRLDRYVAEFTDQQEGRGDNPLRKPALPVRYMVPRRLRRRDLLTPNGSPSGARELPA